MNEYPKSLIFGPALWEAAIQCQKYNNCFVSDIFSLSWTNPVTHNMQIHYIFKHARPPSPRAPLVEPDLLPRVECC